MVAEAVVEVPAVEEEAEALVAEGAADRLGVEAFAMKDHLMKLLRPVR